MRHAFAVVIVVVGLAAPAAHAQFRNQGVDFHLGWIGLGTWDRVLHGGSPARQNIGVGAPEAGWNLTDEPTLGAGYFHAIGYQAWWDFQVGLGAFTTVIDDGDKLSPVITLNTSLGIRYNFLEERFRPFIAGHIHYLQLLAFPSVAKAIAPVPGNGFLGNDPLFFGLSPSGGVEWVFGDEQSLSLEVGIQGYLVPDADRGLGGLFLPSSTARVAYLIYF